MYSSSRSLHFRAIAVGVVSLIAATFALPPSVSARRMIEGRTRTSVNHNSSGFENRNINRNVNVNRNANIDVNRHVDVDVHGGGLYYGRPYYGGGAYAVGVLTGMAIGSIITAASMPPSCTTMVINGIAYRQCGDTWLQPQYNGNQVTYVIINPPR